MRLHLRAAFARRASLARWTLAAALAALQPAQAATDAATREAAAKLAMHVCGTCHGPEGRGDNPRIPRLAAQPRMYIEAQLKAFRSRSRGDYAAHESMWSIAASLNDDIVAALAEYFAAQAPAAGIAPTNKEAAARGRRLFEKGSPERDLPPCTTCHGANGEGLAIFPRLAGQHGAYLFIQLQSIRTRMRGSPLMHGVIKDLTDDDIVALAAYLESK
jgi:cytochrome c553